MNEEYNSNLWFMFIPAINKDFLQAPLLISPSGGPGAPSVYEIFLEIGPYSLNSQNDVESK